MSICIGVPVAEDCEECLISLFQREMETQMLRDCDHYVDHNVVNIYCTFFL